MSYNSAFFDENKRLYKDRENSVHYAISSNVLPLFIGFVKDDVKIKIIEMIKEKRLEHSNCFISQIILGALYKYGETELLFDLIKDRNAWLKMCSEGATTTFEAFSKYKKKNASLFHPVMAFPVLFLTGFDLKKIFISEDR